MTVIGSRSVADRNPVPELLPVLQSGRLRCGFAVERGDQTGKDGKRLVIIGRRMLVNLRRPLTALPMRGARRSFQALVGLYSGERWRSATILDELLRVKAVRQLPDGRVKPLSRSYATVRWDPEGIASLGEELAEHCETLLHNVKDPAHPRFVGRVVNSRIDPRYVPVLLRDLRESAEVFLQTEDSTLNYVGHTINEERNGSSAAGPPTRLGVTVYIFEGQGDEDRDEVEDAVSPPVRRSAGTRSKSRRVDRGSGGKSRV